MQWQQTAYYKNTYTHVIRRRLVHPELRGTCPCAQAQSAMFDRGCSSIFEVCSSVPHTQSRVLELQAHKEKQNKQLYKLPNIMKIVVRDWYDLSLIENDRQPAWQFDRTIGEAVPTNAMARTRAPGDVRRRPTD